MQFDAALAETVTPEAVLDRLRHNMLFNAEDANFSCMMAFSKGGEAPHARQLHVLHLWISRKSNPEFSTGRHPFSWMLLQQTLTFH
jgi:hypothetical protein